jgi:shikimate kinase
VTVKRTAKSIVLIGMMAAGKSSVGRCLAQRMGLAHIDTDELIAARFGISIAEIFSKWGENKFREAETESLRNLATSDPAIIVTGGGVVLRAENVDCLKRLGTIVWLDAEEEKLFERATQCGERPLLQTDNPRKTFSKLLQTRQPLYAKAADFRVDTSRLTQEEVADKILSHVKVSTAIRR